MNLYGLTTSLVALNVKLEQLNGNHLSTTLRICCYLDMCQGHCLPITNRFLKSLYKNNDVFTKVNAIWQCCAY